MDDMISRQAAIKALNTEIIKRRIWGDVNDGTLDEFDTESILRALPSAQPEIIFCRDCRWRKDQSASTAWLPCRAIVTPSDFSCCHAKRRTNGVD